MTQLELRALPLNLNQTTGDDTLSGVVNVPGSQSEILTNPMNGKKFREVIKPGTFAKALQNAKSVDFLYQHDKEKILSTTDNDSLSLVEDEEAGLVMSAKITKTSWGKDAYQMIKDGIVRSMSFGMNVLHDSWERGTDGIPLRIIDEINLIEVSAVRNPAYAASAIEARGIDITEVEIPNMEERDLAEDKKSEVQETEKIEKVDEVSKNKDDKTPKKESPKADDNKSEENPKEDAPKKDSEEKRELEVPVTVSLDEESRALLNEVLAELRKKEVREDESADETRDVESDEPEAREDEEDRADDNDEPVSEKKDNEDSEKSDSEEPEERSLTPEQEAVLEYFG